MAVSAGTSVEYQFPLMFVGNRPGVGNFSIGNFPVKAYVDPTSSVQFLASNGFGSIRDFQATVSGYLVDCSSPNACSAIAP